MRGENRKGARGLGFGSPFRKGECVGTRSARKRRRLLKNMTRHEYSAGGVVVRPGSGHAWDVLLIATHEGARWSLPKGHVEEGESEEAAAVREVREETGIQAEIVAPLDAIEYWFRWRSTEGSVLIHKRVRFFLMRYLAGDPHEHGWEVDDARWFALDEAVQKVSYKDERELLMKARSFLKAHPTLSSEEKSK